MVHFGIRRINHGNLISIKFSKSMNFIQQAYKGINKTSRYIITLILVFVGWQVIGPIPLVLVAWSKAKNFQVFQEAAKSTFMNMGINSNLFLLLLIAMFAFGLISLFIGVKYIHKRSITSLITSRKNIDIQRIMYAFSLWFAIGIGLIAMSYFVTPNDFIWNFKPIPFLILVLISFLLLPIQTSFEELLFRGYLMQWIGVMMRNKWIPLIFTSVVFGLLHASNPEVAKFGGITMVFYIGTGLFFGIITLMDEGTELSLGLHAANNIVSALFVTSSWSALQTDALLKSVAVPSVNWEMYFPVFVLYPLLLLIFYNKYNWTNWKDKLTGKVEKPYFNEG